MSKSASSLLVLSFRFTDAFQPYKRIRQEYTKSQLTLNEKEEENLKTRTDHLHSMELIE